MISPPKICMPISPASKRRGPGSHFHPDPAQPFFLYDLSDNHALILKADTGDPTQFNGTGPFTVANYSPEDRIELQANPNYFVQGQPKLAGVEVIFFSDDTAMADALRGGQVDLMMRIPTPLGEKRAERCYDQHPDQLIRPDPPAPDREPGNKPGSHPGPQAGYRP